MLTPEILLVIASVFLLLSVFMSKIAIKSGVPALLLFLLLGIGAGSEGIGGIYLDDPYLVNTVGVIALVFILFSGGLDTRWRDIRPVLRHGLSLSTVGVVVTAFLVGLFVQTFLGFTLLEGILLGAIIASTDAAAVFTVLRGQQLHLRGRLKSLLEFESGSNDPMSVLLTLGLLQLIVNPIQPVAELLPLFVVQMGIGVILGYFFGRSAVVVFNRVRLEYDGLYPVLSIALMLLAYGVTTRIGGNGFLAIYIMGVVMAQYNFIHKLSLLQFHDGIAWLMQISVFVILGLQVFPSQLVPIAQEGLWVAVFVILVARPVSVFVALAFTRLKMSKKLFIAWVGLRGAAPIVLATFPLLAGIEKAPLIFNLVFFIVFVSVLIQGLLLVPVARLLNVIAPYGSKPRSPLAYVMQDGSITTDLTEVIVPVGASIVGKQIVDLKLPEEARIVLIGRAQDVITPRGGTIIEAEDRLLLLTDTRTKPTILQALECEMT